MAAQITPAESGMKLEPVEKVVDWARINAIKSKLGERAMSYEEFTSQYQGEEL